MLAGVSPARVLRAASALGLGVEQAARRKRRFSAEQVEVVLGRLESDRPRVAGAAGLSDTDVRTLAGLAHAPLGLSSLRAVARAAGLSPAAAAAAVSRLCERAMVIAERHVVAEGAARERLLFHANVDHPDWAVVAPRLQRVGRRGTTGAAPRALTRRVPARLAHAFWNEDLGTLDVGRHGSLIAGRVLRSRDPQALAWASRHLRPQDWQRAAGARGADVRDAALANILARR